MLTSCIRRQGRRHRERGLSLVELMVGITVGLFVVAAAVTLTSGQLTENRRLLLELQIQQDMRATMDIMLRQIRRAGASEPASMQARVADAGLGGLKPDNAAIAVTNPGASPGAISFSYFRNPAETGAYDFQLVNTTVGSGVTAQTVGVVQSRIPGGNWQQLTDPLAMNVTGLVFTPRQISVERLPCPNLCPGPAGPTDCWPEVVVQQIEIEMTAQARTDPTVRRSITGEVRVRNDSVRDNDATALRVCP